MTGTVDTSTECRARFGPDRCIAREARLRVSVPGSHMVVGEQGVVHHRRLAYVTALAAWFAYAGGAMCALGSGQVRSPLVRPLDLVPARPTWWRSEARDLDAIELFANGQH